MTRLGYQLAFYAVTCAHPELMKNIRVPTVPCRIMVDPGVKSKGWKKTKR